MRGITDKQECIPVECLPAAAVAVVGGVCMKNPPGADTPRSRSHPTTPRAMIGNLEGVELLINNGVDVNNTDFKGETALMMAVKMGQRECMELLIKAGADMTKEILDSSLFSEVMKRNFDAVNNLLRAGANAKSPIIETDLLLAALEDQLELVELLVKEGADVKIDDRFLCAASLFGHLGGVPDFILELVETCDYGHEHVMGNIRIIQQKRMRVLKILHSYMLVQACRGECGVFVDALIKAETDVNERDISSVDTPLIAAVRSGSIHCMKSVLQAGARVNVPDCDGYSAFEVLIDTFQRKNCSETKNCMRLLVAADETKMHSSRMRTGRSLTVCCSLLPGGWVSAWSEGGGCLPGPGGWVSAWSRGWVSAWSGGVSAWSGGCLPGPGCVCLVQGVSAWSGGVCLPGLGGCLPGWGGSPY